MTGAVGSLAMPSSTPPRSFLEAKPADDTSFGDILKAFESEHKPKGGQALEGTVVGLSDDLVFVDIGRKMEGVLPAEQFRAPDGTWKIERGAHLWVTITGRNEQLNYTLSTARVERPKDWSGLERAFEEKRVIAGTVTEVVKGGLRVDIGVEAFLPASRSGVRETVELEKLVGAEIRCRLIKLDQANDDAVVDRRAVLEEEALEARQKVFDDLREGAILRGTVRSVTDFGAFVDLGGVDGLLHVADMAWKRVTRPSDIVSAGDAVEVKILKIDPAAHKISLGMKQLVPDPWTLAAEKYTAGDRVRGSVVRVAEFGAFVELEPGVEGLIHVSEMSWGKKNRMPSDIVKPGEAVEVQVLGVNMGQRRIALGLKQTLGDPWDEVERKYPVGAAVECVVTSLTKFGAFVDVEDGIEGMIHIGDITREKRLEHPSEALSVGKRVRAAVLEVDRGRRRLKLGLKQLEPTSIDEYIAEHSIGELVTGRLAEVRSQQAKVELGEGVFANCRLPEEAPQEDPEQRRGMDLSSLTAMLSAKWKQATPATTAGIEPARAGQIRSFRIVALEPSRKRIEVELAG